MPIGVYKHKKGYKRSPFSEEWRKNMSEARRRKSFGGMLGKHHSEKAKRKMSKAQKGVKHPERCDENHPHWRGNLVGHSGLHKWVKRHKRKPKICKDCGATAKEKRLHWSNVDHKYRRNLNDYISRCCECHQKHDRKYNNYKKNVKYKKTIK